MDKKTVKKYAELLVKKGVNLQKGEMLVVKAPVDAADLVRNIVAEAYRAGARNVETEWTDEVISRLGYKHRTKKQLSTVPDWVVDRSEYYIDNKIAYLVIISDDPESLKGINPEKIATARRASGKALKKFRDYTGAGKIRWSLAAYPNKKWAKKVFPDLTPSAAYARLWDYIVKTARLDEDDPLKAWDEHQTALEKRLAALNSANIKTFRYKNSIGTDFTVDMPKGYLFAGGAEKGADDGIFFTANIPTEEVFSCPDKRTANGRLVSAMPLCRNGQIIRNFSIDFKDGRICDFAAEEGYDNLKSIIETDEGSHYLGEIAFVGFNSPIRNLNTLFYETLFDENASCHFAIGDCYPTCVEGGADMTEEELAERGLNTSIEHVDFMVGTKDLSITAIKENGEELKIFENGDWVI